MTRVVHQQLMNNQCYPPPGLREYQTNLASGTQAYQIGKYADNQQKLEASLKRAVAMGLGVGLLKEIQEAKYAPAQPHLVGNLSVDLDLVCALQDCTFLENMVEIYRDEH